MAVNITQTDSAGNAVNQACSATASTGATSRAASVGGTAGSSAVATGNQNNGTHLSKIIIDWAVPSEASWSAGTWTVRINITTGNTNLTLENCHICRMNSSNVSQETIGSLTAQAISASVGTKTFGVTGAAQTPSAGDTVRIIVSVSNQSGQMNQQLSWTPSLNIDTPFAIPTTVSAPVVNHTYTAQVPTLVHTVNAGVVSHTYTAQVPTIEEVQQEVFIPMTHMPPYRPAGWNWP